VAYGVFERGKYVRDVAHGEGMGLHKNPQNRLDSRVNAVYESRCLPQPNQQRLHRQDHETQAGI
jgi:hypothetical protein